MATEGYTCVTCGQFHSGLPRAYTIPLPEPINGMPWWQRIIRVRWSEEGERCVVDGKWFYVRGRILLRIRETAEDFAWGVWASLSRDSYEELRAKWRDPGRERLGPYFAWLVTALPYEPTTLLLKAEFQPGPFPERAHLHLEPTDHPLAVEQREGIDLSRVRSIAERVMGHGPPQM